jgi:hypothetical protein
VIAVLNSSGKLVMESIVETKASSILQYTRAVWPKPSPADLWPGLTCSSWNLI